jgi:hypothetical protein
MDSFGEFIQTESFREVFDLDDAEIERLDGDDEALLQFACRFLKQVLFGEQSIPVKAGARERRLEKRKARIQAKRAEEVARHRAYDPHDEVDPDD